MPDSGICIPEEREEILAAVNFVTEFYITLDPPNRNISSRKVVRLARTIDEEKVVAYM